MYLSTEEEHGVDAKLCSCRSPLLCCTHIYGVSISELSRVKRTGRLSTKRGLRFSQICELHSINFEQDVVLGICARLHTLLYGVRLFYIVTVITFIQS